MKSVEFLRCGLWCATPPGQNWRRPAGANSWQNSNPGIPEGYIANHGRCLCAVGLPHAAQPKISTQTILKEILGFAAARFHCCWSHGMPPAVHRKRDSLYSSANMHRHSVVSVQIRASSFRICKHCRVRWARSLLRENSSGSAPIQRER